MTPESFTYWLQGFVELSDTDTISEKQWLVIKDHLKLVFDKKTPDRYEYKIEVKPTFGEAERLDLIGKKFDRTFWINNPPAITC